MCGIAGFTRFKAHEGTLQTLESMGNSIFHRGPDAHGEYLDDYVGLCHRRLSIIDLTRAGDQPMSAHNDNHVIVFNGEIYNFQQLREDLIKEGYSFKTKTDTEVILALYGKYGESCVNQLNGMFAFAIWDTTKQTLFLARDRLGKKPLYYFVSDNDIVFASEIKAILKFPNIRKEIRTDALYDFFTYQYVPDPKTIFKNIYKLSPGHTMTVTPSNITISKYWDLSFRSITKKTEEECSEELHALLNTCVKDRMVSDVPLGAFLSGGVDSSAVVSLMASNQSSPVKTCSIGFDSKKYDEVKYAQTIADLFHTSHSEMTVKERVVDHIEPISSFFDEPFADPSLVPTYFVSKLARNEVTVALAGDGGDENFAGYQKYSIDQTENKLRNHFPAALRKTVFPALAKLLAGGNHPIFRKGNTLLTTLSASPAYGFYLTNAFLSDSLWNFLARPELKQELSGYHPFSVTQEHYEKADTDDHLSRILYTDIKTYLPGDILVKVDRMSMANSLEVRAPLLDYRLFEFSAKLPSELKLHGKEKKYILKKAFEKHLPNDILYRKKMGFSVPLADWLRNDIRSYTEKMLFEPDNGISQFFKIDSLRFIWESHLNGKRDYSNELWSFLMFEIWWNHYIQS